MKTESFRNVYFNVLDDIIKKYSNTVDSSIKMKPKNVTDTVFVEYSDESNKKDPKFKDKFMLEFQNIKMFFLRVMHLIGVKKSLL